MIQDFNVPIERKNLYGEVATDYKIVDIMLDLLPVNVWKNKNLKWLDVGCGQGYISKRIYNRLQNSLLEQFSSLENCQQHILQNMLYMIDINPFHLSQLKLLFGENANIIIDNFIDTEFKLNFKVDIIVENPPYNINGSIKTPTNNNDKKIVDGVTVWRDFLFKSLNFLNTGGILSIITPSIWLRNDKFNVYSKIFNNHKLLKCRCLSASETSRAFHSKAQTPTAMYSIMKGVIGENKADFWDNDKFVTYKWKPREPIPLKNYRFISDLRENIQKSGHLDVIKTSCILKTNQKHPEFSFIAIKSRSIKGNLVFEYCKYPTKYQHDKKIIMANKMYGMPFIDNEGKYGISTRDNYIILKKTDKEMKILAEYINSDKVQRIFDSFRYRMRYLEREAFLFVPDILT